MSHGRALAAETSPSSYVCNCGTTNHKAHADKCPIIQLFNNLTAPYRSFLLSREVMILGMDGPLYHGLRANAQETYKLATECLETLDDQCEARDDLPFTEFRRRLQEHLYRLPEDWTGYRETPTPLSVVPGITGDEDPALRAAKQATIDCHDSCLAIIVDWIRDPHMIRQPEEYRQYNVGLADSAYQTALDMTSALPPAQAAQAQDLEGKA
ncbi:hypothetical protein diail_12327 [Diaporthe ilicicola]|nr:hypothetical protein diail_12327 [Diaporthe ilicicola]